MSNSAVFINDPWKYFKCVRAHGGQHESFAGTREGGWWNCICKPRFAKFHKFFVTALAFCNFSNIQKFRRRIISHQTFPRALGSRWKLMDKFGVDECHHITKELAIEMGGGFDMAVDVDCRPIILKVGKTGWEMYSLTKKLKRAEKIRVRQRTCFINNKML